MHRLDVRYKDLYKYKDIYTIFSFKSLYFKWI